MQVATSSWAESGALDACSVQDHAAEAFHLTALTVLQQNHGCGYSREFVREKVLGWAIGRWPEVFVGRSACDPNFETHSASANVRVTTTNSGSYGWTFRGRLPDGSERSHREIRVVVTGDAGRDLMAVRTGHFGDPEVNAVAGQPQFLQTIVDHLDFDDGGFPVLATPRKVMTGDTFENFYEHLMSARRGLPILAIGHSEGLSEKRGGANGPFLDAHSIARLLCGLAHVVSLGSDTSSRLERRLGQGMGVCAEEARLFMPALGKTPGPQGHPRFAAPRLVRCDSASASAKARAAACEWSLSAPRRMQFDALWAAAGGG